VTGQGGTRGRVIFVEDGGGRKELLKSLDQKREENQEERNNDKISTKALNHDYQKRNNGQKKGGKGRYIFAR